MNTELNDDNIIGLPKDKYIKLTYVLLMVSSALGFIGSVIHAVTGIGGLIGLAGVILALLGFFVFKEKFDQKQLSHFKYLGALFLIFFILGLAVGSVLQVGYVAMVIGIILNVASLGLLFLGFRLNEKGLEASKDNIVKEAQSLKP